MWSVGETRHQCADQLRLVLQCQCSDVTDQLAGVAPHPSGQQRGCVHSARMGVTGRWTHPPHQSHSPLFPNSRQVTFSIRSFLFFRTPIQKDKIHYGTKKLISHSKTLKAHFSSYKQLKAKTQKQRSERPERCILNLAAIPCHEVLVVPFRSSSNFERS